MRDKVFISYRRGDADAHALSVAQYLERDLDPESVFIDVDRIKAGENFPRVLDDHLKRAGVLLAVIGPTWLSVRDEDDNPRLSDPKDWVRLEIERALAQGLVVVPVLVGGATLPKEEDLPATLRPMLQHNAVTLTSTGFRHVMAGLLQDIRPHLQQTWSRRYRRSLIATAATVLVVAAGWAALNWLPFPSRSQASLDDPALANLQEPAKPAGYCDGLKKVVAAGPGRFETILRAQREDWWISAIQLPGWLECEVSELTQGKPDTRYHTCELSPFATRAAATKMMEAISADLAPCLGPSWSRQDRRRSNGMKAVDYYLDTQSPSVGLRIRQNLAKVWEVKLDVDLPY